MGIRENLVKISDFARHCARAAFGGDFAKRGWTRLSTARKRSYSPSDAGASPAGSPRRRLNNSGNRIRTRRNLSHTPFADGRTSDFVNLFALLRIIDSDLVCLDLTRACDQYFSKHWHTGIVRLQCPCANVSSTAVVCSRKKKRSSRKVANQRLDQARQCCHAVASAGRSEPTLPKADLRPLPKGVRQNSSAGLFINTPLQRGDPRLRKEKPF